MVFSSHVFLYYFLPLALLAYYASPLRWRQMVIALLSYVFYGWANPWFIFLMLFSTTVDYVCGLLISGQRTLRMFAGDEPAGPGMAPARQRKFALVTSIAVNLSLLGFFKYLGFFETNLNYLLEVLGRPALEVYTITLPVGISFYTFQSMSYSIDLYRGDARPARDFLDFACYVSLFPQLVAGPIVRYQDLAEQLRERSHTLEKFARGVLFFAFGMAKKVLLANPMGAVADAAFDAGGLAWYDAWTGVTAYAFQIYFDFSGYSDMAIGLGLMLGFEFKRNFDLPYLSRSITEFWRRLLLAAERWRNKSPIYARLPGPLPALCTFVVVLITWVFFRAESFGQSVDYLSAMFGVAQPAAASPLITPLLYQPQYLLVMVACVVIHLLRLDTWDAAQEVRPARMAWASVAMLASAAILFTQSYNPFLYFRF